jgi:outer membrane protein assembly factor BamD
MKIANIHYKEMEKADRDPTHARRAEDEYRQLILQFPDSPLVPQAKQRLLEVQEVLADREYMIGHFYFLRETYPAAIARLKSVADTYPLYSGADQALYELGNSYEKEVDLIRLSKLPETAKGALIKQYTDGATAAYDRILTRYPLDERAEDAKKRLQAMKQPVPHATEAAIAQDKAEIASRGTPGHFGKLMENFRKGPDVTEAAKVGEPTLVDPKQVSAPDMVRAANSSIMGSLSGSNKVGVERVENGAAPAANAPIPRSDAEPVAPAGSSPTVGNAAGATPATAPAEAVAGGAGNGSPSSAASDNSAVPEMKNDLQPAGTTPPPGTTAPPLGQTNDAASSSSSDSSTQPAPAASSGSAQQPTAVANANTESSSKKKKKHHWPF